MIASSLPLVFLLGCPLACHAADSTVDPLAVFVKNYQEMTPQTIFLFDVGENTHDRVRCIGKGSFGSVELWTAKDGSAGPKQVAVKTIYSSVDSFDEQVKELYILKAIQHPNVLSLLSGYGDHHKIVIITDYYDQGSLSLYHYDGPRFGAMGERQVQHVVLDMLEACAYLQSVRIIHRDIKPANIALSSTGAKLIDFGLCTEPYVGPERRFTERLGTALFIAPEMIVGKEYDYNVDIWALGITIWGLFLDPYPSTPDRPIDKASNDPRMVFDACILAGGPWGDKGDLPASIRAFIDASVIFNYRRRPYAQVLLQALRGSWNLDDQ